MKNFFSVLLFFILIGNNDCFTQGKKLEWTLKQCIDHALEHNLQVKNSVLNTLFSKENLVNAKGQGLPNLNGFATHSYNFGQTIDPFTNLFAVGRVQSNNFALSSSVSLFNGLQNYNNIRQNQLNVLAAQSDEEKVKNDISISVTLAFLQVLFSEELLVASENQAAITQQQLRRMRKMVEVGSLPKAKLLELEAQMAMEELNIVNSENQKNTAYLTLKHALDLGFNDELKIIPPVISIPKEPSVESTPGQVYDAALGILPEIKGAEYRLLGSGRSLKMAQGGRSPRLQLQGSFGTGFSGLRKEITDAELMGAEPTGFFTASGESVLRPTFHIESRVLPFGQQVNENLNKSIGLNLTVPIFNGLSVKTNIAKAKIVQQQAENELAMVKNQVQKNIQQAYSDALSALKKYHATRKSLEALEESFKYAEKKFAVGEINAVEYNDAKNKTGKAQSDLLQAKYDFVFRQKILDFYQGKSLAF